MRIFRLISGCEMQTLRDETLLAANTSFTSDPDDSMWDSTSLNIDGRSDVSETTTVRFYHLVMAVCLNNTSAGSFVVK